MDKNGNKCLKVNEFCMFINGPFATNIYIDIAHLEKLNKKPLSSEELKILRCIQNKSMKKKKIQKQTGIVSSSFSDLFKDLSERGLIVPDDQKHKTLFSSGEYFIITFEGQEELRKNNTGKEKILDNFIKTMNDESNNNYEVKAGKDSYKDLFENLFFDSKERAFILSTILLNDFSICLMDNEIGQNDLKFERNMIHLFASGIGIFTTKVIVKLYNEIEVGEIRETIEKKVIQVIKDCFNNKIMEINRTFSKNAAIYFKLIPRVLHIDSSKVGNCAWLHTIYWFYGDQYSLNDNESKPIILEYNTQKGFSKLLDQEHEFKKSFLDHYAYYGWGRSLLLTKSGLDCSTKEWVERSIKLVELSQYFCLGLTLLDYVLTKKLSEIMVNDSMNYERQKNFYKLRDFKNIQSAIIRYLEQFRSGVNVILQSGQISLLNKLEEQWHLKQLEKNISDKLRSIESEVTYEEHLLAQNKQDSLNKVAVIFTIFSIVLVVVAIQGLEPLKHEFKKPPMFLFWNELFFVFIVSVIIIGVIMYFVLKYSNIHPKIFQRIRRMAYEKTIIKKYESSKGDKTKCQLSMQKLRIKFMNQCDLGRINKSDFDILDEKISELENK